VVIVTKKGRIVKMKKINLLLNSSEYNTQVDWKEGCVKTISPRRGKDDGYGNWILPSPLRPPRGISSQFANLRNTERSYYKEDLEAFTSKFGLLGITGLPSKDGALFMSPKYGKTHSEDIKWWLYYANEVYLLLRLYSILKRGKDNANYDAEGALEEILVFEQDYKVCHEGTLQDNGQFTFTTHKKKTPFLRAIWKESRVETGQAFESETLTIEAAAYVLTSVISRNLAGGITIGKGEIKESRKSPIGYAIVEQRYTNYLLAAIYYDLWELITNSQPVEVCAYSECNGLFTPKRKTGKYCSNTCRVADWRRKNGSIPVQN
jgi:hypothetical protein